MLPSECPYPETNPENPASHPLGSSAMEGNCAQCQRYYRRCPDCQAANRWLSRFCRNCGHSLTPVNWLPDLADTPLHHLPMRRPTRWSGPVESGLTPMWAGLLDGRVFMISNRGELRHLLRHPLRLEQPQPGNTPLASPPSYLHGFLAIPGEDQITLIDLLDSRGGARKVQRLRGPLLCPIASDNAQWLAALVMDGENRGLQLFRLHQGRLQLAWNQVLEGSGPDPNRFPRLLWCDDTLLYQTEEGVLSGIDPHSGVERFHLQCPCPPATLAPWVSGPHCYWGGSDGSLWWLKLKPDLQLHQLCGAQSLPMLAMAAGPRDLVASFGRTLLRVQLETSRCESLELPQYFTTSPWVGTEDALALSQEGQLYQLSLGTQTFQVESTEKVPSPFNGSLLPPFWNGREWMIFDQDGRLFVGE
ncbi:hypothetical protein IV102_32800 [bacterium]|nr:hypothetical protein [bacterium]